MSVLVVDVGNSRTKFAICDSKAALPTCAMFVAFDNSDAGSLLKKLTQFAGSGCEHAVVAGSNTHLREAIVEHWPAVLPLPTVLRDWNQVPVGLGIETPETVGIDRLLNAHGAVMLDADRPAVVVDSGTATTVDLVRDKTFLGGAILPGLRMSARALHEYTAALPHIDTGLLSIENVVVPGTDTQSALEAGVLIGQIGAIREIVQRYRHRCPNARLILTGGAGERLAPAFEDAEVAPYLSLRAMASLVPRP